MGVAATLRRRSDATAWRWALPAFAAAYALAVVVGRATRLEGTQLALVWPAAGVAVLWLLHAQAARQPYRHAVALVVVTAAANLATGAPPSTAATFAVANLLQAVVAVALLGEGFALRSVGALGRLLLASTVGALVSGLVGSLALRLLVGAELPLTFGLWTVRNATSCLVIVAVAVRLRDAAAVRRTGAGPAEGALVAALLVGGALLVHAAPWIPAAFVLLPLSIWVALRCSTTLASLHVLCVAVAVVVLGQTGQGAFAGQVPVARVLLAQAFVLLVALVVLSLALTSDERADLVGHLRREQQRSVAQAAMLQTVLDTVDVAIVAADAAGRPVLVNRTARALHDLADGSRLPAAVPVDRVLREGDLSDALLVVDVPGRPVRTVRSEGRALRDPDGVLLGAVVVQTDVTALHASEQQFRAAFEDGPTPTARLDDAGRVEQTNAALRRLLALPSKRLLGRELADLAAVEDRELLRAAAEDRTGRGPVEARLLRADGRGLWCEVSRTRVRPPGAVPYVLVQVLDVHTRKAHELALEDVAHRDALTGLDNRHVLDRRLAELLRADQPSHVVLAYLDLDDFKAVNDAHGHDAGDAVLRAVGQRLLSLVRAEDVAARLGGDEFVLACVVPDGERAEAFAGSLAERVEQALSQPVRHGELRLDLGVSVGTAVAPSSGDPAEVLRRADLAMYERKRVRKVGPARASGARPAPLPADEPARLAALHAMGLLDTPPDRALDELCEAAALVAGVPTALITLVDEHRQWCKARCGTDLEGTGRDESFCAYVVALDREVHVEDARRDPRFADNPLVTGELALRSYAGLPLRTVEGHVLGSLCVLGDVPGLLDEAQRRVLRMLAGQAEGLLRAHAPDGRSRLGGRLPAQRTAPAVPTRTA